MLTLFMDSHYMLRHRLLYVHEIWHGKACRFNQRSEGMSHSEMLSAAMEDCETDDD